ncbi:MAG: type II secretion system F family protein [Lachnospiraceae bacterium]|nr:type II secretion system F family protein [Lachnospiraceae bacterium]
MTSKEISSFCFKLHNLIHAGIRLGDAISLMSDGTDSSWMKTLTEQIDNGDSLSEAMKHTKQFPAYVCGLVEVGEQTGYLENVLFTLSDYYEKREKFDRYLKDTLAYPLEMMLLVLVVIGIILIKVMPIFDDVYSSFGTKMTGIAAGLLTFGSLLDNMLPVLFIVMVLLLSGTVAFTKIKKFREKIISLCGDKGIAYKINNSRIVQALALGISSGLKVDESLKLASNLVSDIPKAKDRCLQCIKLLDNNKSETEALSESGILDKQLCKLLEFGQRSGTEDISINKIADDMLDESEQDLNKLVGSIEPGIVMISSLLIGMILLSVMLPLINIMLAIS